MASTFTEEEYEHFDKQIQCNYCWKPYELKREEVNCYAGMYRHYYQKCPVCEHNNGIYMVKAKPAKNNNRRNNG